MNESAGNAAPQHEAKVALRKGDWDDAAARFLPRCFQSPLRYYNGDHYQYSDGAYRPVCLDTIKMHARYFLQNAVLEKLDDNGRQTFVPFCPKMNDVAELVGAATQMVTVPSENLKPPVWLLTPEMIAQHDLPPADEVVSFPNGILHLPTRRFVEPCPQLFTTSALRFDYEPDANPTATLTTLGIATVRRLAAAGCNKKVIATELGLSVGAFYRVLERQEDAREALDIGTGLEEAHLVNLLRIAADKGNVIAAMFLLKTRHGYLEGSAPTTVVPIQITLPGALTPQQYAERLAARQAAVPPADAALIATDVTPSPAPGQSDPSKGGKVR